MNWQNIQSHLDRAGCNDEVDRTEAQRGYELRAAFGGLLGYVQQLERRIAVLEERAAR